MKWFLFVSILLYFVVFVIDFVLFWYKEYIFGFLLFGFPLICFLPYSIYLIDKEQIKSFYDKKIGQFLYMTFPFAIFTVFSIVIRVRDASANDLGLLNLIGFPIYLANFLILQIVEFKKRKHNKRHNRLP